MFKKLWRRFYVFIISIPIVIACFSVLFFIKMTPTEDTSFSAVYIPAADKASKLLDAYSVCAPSTCRGKGLIFANGLQGGMDIKINFASNEKIQAELVQIFVDEFIKNIGMKHAVIEISQISKNIKQIKKSDKILIDLRRK